MVDKLKEVGRRRRRANEETSEKSFTVYSRISLCSAPSKNLTPFPARILHHLLQQSCRTNARVLQVNTHTISTYCCIVNNVKPPPGLGCYCIIHSLGAWLTSCKDRSKNDIQKVEVTRQAATEEQFCKNHQAIQQTKTEKAPIVQQWNQTTSIDTDLHVCQQISQQEIASNTYGSNGNFFIQLSLCITLSIGCQHFLEKLSQSE